MTDTKDKKPIVHSERSDEIDPINARLDAIEKDLKGTIDQQAQVISDLQGEIDTLKKRPTNFSSDEDEGIIIDRQSANTMRLPIVNDVPVISGQLERVVGVQGIEYLMKVETADGKKYKFPIGCDVKQLDFSNEKLKGVETISYESIQTKDFALQDIDENDLTGASKIEKGKIVAEGGLVNQIDRSTGEPRLTGKKIRTIVRRDIRHYTIEFEGKKFTMSSEELGNFRI